MKRYFLYIGLALFALSACRKTDVEPAFYASPEKRMADTLSMLRNTLTGAQYGWKAGLSTGLSGGYGFYFEFNEANEIKMLSDISTASGNTAKTSTYRLSATSVASLLFDTYNYITLLQDPDGTISGGIDGQGLRSDIEFSYKRKRGDSLFFVGKKYEQPLTLVKASEAEQQAFLAGGLNTFKNGFANIYNTNYTFANLSAEQNGNMVVELDYTSKQINFANVNTAGEVVSSQIVPFYYTANDLSLVSGNFVPFNGKVIKALRYDADKVFAIFTDNSTQEMLSQATPLYKFDLVFDYNKNFKKLVAGDAIPGVTAEVHIFDRVRQLFTASTRNITQMYFGFDNSTTATYYIAYTSGSSNFVASATYEYRRQGPRIFFKRVSVNNNWDTRSTQVAPVNAFFGTGDEREFVLDWITSSSNTVKFPIGAIKSVSNLNNVLYGRLGE